MVCQPQGGLGCRGCLSCLKSTKSTKSSKSSKSKSKSKSKQLSKSNANINVHASRQKAEWKEREQLLDPQDIIKKLVSLLKQVPQRAQNATGKQINPDQAYSARFIQIQKQVSQYDYDQKQLSLQMENGGFSIPKQLLLMAQDNNCDQILLGPRHYHHHPLQQEQRKYNYEATIKNAINTQQFEVTFSSSQDLQQHYRSQTKIYNGFDVISSCFDEDEDQDGNQSHAAKPHPHRHRHLHQLHKRTKVATSHQCHFKYKNYPNAAAYYLNLNKDENNNEKDKQQYQEYSKQLQKSREQLKKQTKSLIKINQILKSIKQIEFIVDRIIFNKTAIPLPQFQNNQFCVSLYTFVFNFVINNRELFTKNILQQNKISNHVVVNNNLAPPPEVKLQMEIPKRNRNKSPKAQHQPSQNPPQQHQYQQQHQQIMKNLILHQFDHQKHQRQLQLQQNQRNQYNHYPIKIQQGTKDDKCKTCKRIGCFHKSKYKCQGCSISAGIQIRLCLGCFEPFHQNIQQNFPQISRSKVRSQRSQFRALNCFNRRGDGQLQLQLQIQKRDNADRGIPGNLLSDNSEKIAEIMQQQKQSSPAKKSNNNNMNDEEEEMESQQNSSIYDEDEEDNEDDHGDEEQSSEIPVDIPADILNQVIKSEQEEQAQINMNGLSLQHDLQQQQLSEQYLPVSTSNFNFNFNDDEDQGDIKNTSHHRKNIIKVKRKSNKIIQSWYHHNTVLLDNFNRQMIQRSKHHHYQYLNYLQQQHRRQQQQQQVVYSRGPSAFQQHEVKEEQQEEKFLHSSRNNKPIITIAQIKKQSVIKNIAPDAKADQKEKTKGMMDIQIERKGQREIPSSSSPSSPSSPSSSLVPSSQSSPLEHENQAHIKMKQKLDAILMFSHHKRAMAMNGGYPGFFVPQRSAVIKHEKMQPQSSK